MKKSLISILLFAATAVLSAQSLSLSLEDCRALSEANDPYVRNAALDLAAARAQKQEALAAWFPSVSANAVAYHSLNPLIDLGVTDILGTSDAAWNISNIVDELAPQYGLPSRYRALQYGYGVSVTVMQPIYAGGRIIAGNRLVGLGVEAAELKRSLVSRDNGSTVEEKYWLVVSLQEKALTLASAGATLERIEKDASSAFSAGLIPESDLLQVRLKRSELTGASVKLAGGTKLAKMDLLNAIGVQYSTLSAVSDSLKPHIDSIRFSDIPGGMPSPDEVYVPEEKIAESMEEHRLLDIQVDARRLERKMTLGEALPEVGIGGMAGYGRFLGDGKVNGALYAMVKIPISQWGATSRRLVRQDCEIQKAVNERDYLDAQLVLKARQMWVNLTTSWEEMKISEEALSVAADCAERLSANYSAGLVPVSELLQAQTSLRQSEDALTDSRIAYRKALASYLSFSAPLQ